MRLLPQLLGVEHRSTFIQFPGESALDGDALVFAVCAPVAFIKKQQLRPMFCQDGSFP